MPKKVRPPSHGLSEILVRGSIAEPEQVLLRLADKLGPVQPFSHALNKRSFFVNRNHDASRSHLARPSPFQSRHVPEHEERLGLAVLVHALQTDLVPADLPDHLVN